MYRIGVICVLLSLCMGQAFAYMGNPEAGQKKSETCVACHGEGGKGEAPNWPNLGGLSYDYLYKQLMDFKQGEEGPRYDPSMYGMVMNFNERDLADLAAFYAMQKGSIGEIEEGKYELGRQIYRGGNTKTGVTACGACHGANGKGNTLANFPSLSGQNPEYIVEQLKKFKTGERANDINGIMRDIAKRMSDEEMEAVGSYVSGLY